MEEKKNSITPLQAAVLDFVCLKNSRIALYFQVMAKINFMGY